VYGISCSYSGFDEKNDNGNPRATERSKHPRKYRGTHFEFGQGNVVRDTRQLAKPLRDYSQLDARLGHLANRPNVFIRQVGHR
jgi:hypothetical protein